MKKSWSWDPDTIDLSREPLKTKIAFALGNDSNGTAHMIVDANNNYDFSDDKSFIPHKYIPTENLNKDSLVLSDAIHVSFERLIHNKKETITAPLLIIYMDQFD